MHGWRLRIFLALGFYVAAMALWATRPWTDTHALVVPDNRSPGFAEYECPSVFGRGPGVKGLQILSGSREPAQPDDPQYPPAGTPCDEQDKHRVLLVVDVAAAGIAMLALQRSSVRHRAATELDDARAAEVAET